MGARTKLKAAGAGDKEGKPPAGHHSGRGRADNAGGQAPRPPGTTAAEVEPATLGASPPPRKVPAWQAL